MSDLVKIFDAFVQASRETLEAEFQLPVAPGAVFMSMPGDPMPPVLALVGLAGELEGVVTVGATRETACAIAGMLLGEQIPEVTPLVESAMGEICNIICGRGTALLQEMGYNIIISPPIVVTGTGVRLHTADLPRLAVPFHSELGDIELKVAAHYRANRGEQSGAATLRLLGGHV